MKGEKGPFAHVGAAAILAFLTLAVFLISQGRGPQSAVKRLHEAVETGDRAAAEALQVNVRLYSSKALADDIYTLTRTSRSIQFGRTVTRGPESEVEVVYDSAIYGLRAIKFSLQKAPDGWRIDSAKTLARTRESSLF
jgi:hypothetical protein